jgi:hypothetical protein
MNKEAVTHVGPQRQKERKKERKKEIMAQIQASFRNKM